MKLKWSLKSDVYNQAGEIDSEGIFELNFNFEKKTIIDSFIAEISFAANEKSRYFVNGYQSWTLSKEYEKKEKMHSLNKVPKFILNKYKLNKYGDYDFVQYSDQKGIFQGFSYGYIRNDDYYKLYASLNEDAYTLLKFDTNKNTLFIQKDLNSLEVEGQYCLLKLLVCAGEEREVFERWFSLLNISKKEKESLCGYSSWYNRYQDIDSENIKEDLSACQKLFKQGDLFQIDDGWQIAVGDWQANSKFNDLKDIVKQIHEKGFKAGLWLAPFVAEGNSKVYQQHPDWFLKENEEIYCAGSNWSNFYSLDIDNIEVIDYLKEVFNYVWDLGFDLVKLDFLYAVAPFNSRKETRATRMKRACELLRELCGNKLILGCGTPLMPAFSLFDYCRIGCDVSLDYDDKWFMHYLHNERISTKSSLMDTIYRYPLDSYGFGNDPDVFFLRDNNCKLSPYQKEVLAKVNALLGTVWLTSDDIGSYDEEKKKQYLKLRELKEAGNIYLEIKDDLYIINYELKGEKLSYEFKL